MTASPGGGVAVQGLDHVGIVVGDLDRAAGWLATVLGARVGEPVALSAGRVADCALDGGVLQLIELEASAGSPFALASDDAGAFHICLRVADIDAAHRRLRDEGARFTTPPERSAAGPAIAYFRDPLGLPYQLIEVAAGALARGPGPAPAGTLHHIGLTLPDLDDAVAWFDGVLRLGTTLTTAAAGELPSRMLEVPDAAYRAAMVDLGDRWLEVMQFERPRSAQRALPAAAEVGALHLALRVGDLGAARGILRERGIDVLATDGVGGPLVEIPGPGGLRIQLRAAAPPT